ncbi:flagellin lysine-N-methylase [Aneurinibacillus tyrosinisolvens]|uniref:flagellin lysine-N-methylase n=1 Tax=Aneurinibacillus tyrosinisolvens TaxID=1443435 RepID=UPI00063FB85F|nr:flagellin lysine-N-methylase [Aneurinibacillus tyrosinisolvens]
MTKKNRLALVPAYMNEFMCIGSECEDSCCIGWRVDIDRNTYKKYNKIRDKELTPLLNSKVKRNRSNPTDGNYAKINLNNDSTCPMLTEEKLCTIQLKVGEEYLSDVCTTYPRTSNIVNNLLEKSATMSCPQAARLALLNPEGIEFDEVEESIHARNIVSRQVGSSNKNVAHRAEKYFWELRIFTIQLLQNRKYSLSDRLIITGMFYQKLNEYMEAGQLDEIPELIASYTNLISGGVFKESLEKIPVDVAIQVKLLKELSDIRASQGINSGRYFECFAQFLHGLEISKEATVEETSEKYRQAYMNTYQPFMNEHEYIMENYLVNYVFKNLFPFTGHENLFDNYVMLVIHYALIKMHLIGMSAFHKGLTAELVIKLIQSFAKTVEHNPLYLKKVYDLLKQNEVTTMAYMAILIKN